MLKKLLIFIVALQPLDATTIEVVQVFQPISLYGTDSAEEGKNETVVEAVVLSRPMALGGAFPEVLVESVAWPHRLPSTSLYTVEECNLFVMCQIGLSTLLSEEAGLKITIDVEKMTIPEELNLRAVTILEHCIDAIEKTLWTYPMAEGESLACEIEVVGTTEKNSSFVKLGKKFVLGEE